MTNRVVDEVDPIAIVIRDVWVLIVDQGITVVVLFIADLGITWVVFGIRVITVRAGFVTVTVLIEDVVVVGDVAAEEAPAE